MPNIINADQTEQIHIKYTMHNKCKKNKLCTTNECLTDQAI